MTEGLTVSLVDPESIVLELLQLKRAYAVVKTRWVVRDLPSLSVLEEVPAWHGGV